MIRSERLTTILDTIADTGTVTVEQLVEDLDISPATARRDLDALAERGLLRRTRGGARSNIVAFDTPVRQKRMQQLTEKTTIARHCLSYLEPGCVVGMSGGSTVGTIAQQLVEWAAEQTPGGDVPTTYPVVTVVTNAIDIAYLLAGSTNMKIVLIGGVLNGNSYELTGPLGATVLGQLSMDVAFLGANGIDENGPGTVDEFEAQTNRMMATRAITPVVVADHAKFGRRSFSSLGGTDTVSTIVTDAGVDPDWSRRLTQLGYNVVVARQDSSPVQRSVI
ncbi:DeoR/GlpR family DNA-binding transcription regulator [Corynebacterium pygosceleis]|uniref:DeoR/GlpR family DNA-binding transcription regulator n=1 Tax=Corynebacterium pygosceleis TaxID=2800406 RepID=A0A9Q4C9J4_9CORY|nr:DeoR/GlpR family DNA-binding transcription regulator [Corynebacterium pygosceleis]MCK7638263.1 DeoR/GlpR family DNA-binding transcription regulator [Corynebacterium pygosceleis]MCK7675244.1 DeoR/GlpR family DNA-binding transcription regulator [Corynebacterium pygosceleis]MCL0121362.1 DeoR/GlpR family DNA-binding transcription regulator [Corynebacterium pygosceleis]MCX7445624.1 DeoR/GlpR family DNA-binding transcription regulator [Corynebacterium pygosceleis]MCX7468924.1 DeoR/GlpR family DNA